MNMSCLTGKQLIAEQVTACWKAKVRLNWRQTLKFQCNIRYNPLNNIYEILGMSGQLYGVTQMSGDYSEIFDC